jgi:hypothetical protein
LSATLRRPQILPNARRRPGQDAKLSFEVQPNGQVKLNVDRLGALGQSESLKWLWLCKTTSRNAPEGRPAAGPAVR